MDATQCPIAHTAWLLFVRDEIDECKDDYKNIVYEAITTGDFHGIPLLHSKSLNLSALWCS